ncbi:MAG: penicillin-binding transpeptidase domain-containing protein [Candidatus Brocadiia bacterium]
MYRFRVRVVLILIFGGMLMVSTRLFYLQVVRGSHYRHIADNVRLDQRETEANRGQIFDCDGERLAFDAPAFNLALAPTRLPQWRRLCRPVLDLYRLRRRERVLSVEEVEIDVQPLGSGGLEVSFEVAAAFLRRKGTELVERDERHGARFRVPAPVMALLERLAEAAVLGRGGLESPDEEAVAGPVAMVEAFMEGLAQVGRGWRRLGSPCVVARDVGFAAAAEVESHQAAYPGVRVVVSAKRVYPYNQRACHLLGYMQQVSAGEYRRWQESYAGSPAKRFLPDDVIGRAGIERALDPLLRPARGEQLVEVDAARRTQQILSEVPAVPGADVYLTIDQDVQALAERLLEGHIGAVVLLEARSGRILAMASQPGFDPNEMPRPVDPERAELAPRLNRATQGEYPLGSAFKLLLAQAALEEGCWFREITCRGEYRGHECHNHRLPMVVDFHNAIKRSCNVYFYRTAERLGIHRIAKWASRFGLGRPTGVELPVEGDGLLPTAQWKSRRFGEAWYPGDTRNLAIGQGYLLVTPLQVARMVAALANGGRLVRPRLVDRVVYPDGTEEPWRAGEEAAALGLSPSRLAMLHRAMRAVCHERGGTGWRAWSSSQSGTPWIEEQGYAVAGKTSTADCPLRGRRSNVGWFVGFAPAREARLAFVVVLEHEGQHLHGGDVAAPLARRLLAGLPERYLEGVPGKRRREERRQRLAAKGGGP